MQTKPLLDAMTGTLNKEQAKTLCHELNDVEAKALVNTLLDMGEDVEAETLGNQQCNVQAESLIHKVSYALSKPTSNKGRDALPHPRRCRCRSTGRLAG